MLSVNSFGRQQQCKSSGRANVILQDLQSLLHSRKRCRTYNIAQAINHYCGCSQRRDDTWKLFGKKVGRTDVPRYLALDLLLFHAEAVDEPHLPLLKITIKTPAEHSHLAHNILPRPSSCEVDRGAPLVEALVEYLFGTSGHPGIRLAEKCDYAA